MAFDYATVLAGLIGAGASLYSQHEAQKANKEAAEQKSLMDEYKFAKEQQMAKARLELDKKVAMNQMYENYLNAYAGARHDALAGYQGISEGMSTPIMMRSRGL